MGASITRSTPMIAGNDGMEFAPGLVGTSSGGDDDGDGCHDPSPSIKGSHSCRGSGLKVDRERRRLSVGRRRVPPRETSCSIGEPLALGTYERAIGAGLIVNAEPNSVVVPEIELGRVAMQVRLADVEVAAVDPALEDREVVFGGVGVPKRTTHVFLRGVINGTVPRELAADRPIDRAFVGHQVAGLVHVGENDRLQGLRGDIRNVEATDTAIALNQRQHGSLGRNLAFTVRRLAADKGFVSLDNQISAPERISLIDLQHGHRLADAVSEKPCGLEATAEGTVELTGRDPLLAGAHQIDSLKPDVHRHVAKLEHTAHAHREWLAAGAAFPQAGARALALQLRCFADRAAVRTNRTIGPQSAFDIGDSGFFVAKLRGVKGGLHGGCSPQPRFYLWGSVCQV